jgi:hypothetical protein
MVVFSINTAPHDRTLQEAERSVRVKLADEKLTAREAEFLADLRRQYPVQIDEHALAAIEIETQDGGRD